MMRLLLLLMLVPSLSWGDREGLIGIEPFVTYAHAGDVEAKVQTTQTTEVVETKANDHDLLAGLRLILPISRRAELRPWFAYGKLTEETKWNEGLIRKTTVSQNALYLSVSVRFWVGKRDE